MWRVMTIRRAIPKNSHYDNEGEYMGTLVWNKPIRMIILGELTFKVNNLNIYGITFYINNNK